MLFTIIPLPYYTPIFYYLALLVVIFSCVRVVNSGYVIQSYSKKDYASLLLCATIVLYMGLRPISYYFGDMTTYNHLFKALQSNQVMVSDVFYVKDPVWLLFVKTCSAIMSAKMFFLCCAMLYVVPLYVASKKYLKEDRFLLFLMLIASFSFWAYGTNGIRNGIATSLFLWGISFFDKKMWCYLLLALSYLIHGSMLIPIMAYVFSVFFKNTKYYLVGWLICISFSLVLGGAIESFLGATGIGGDRAGYLTDDRFKDSFASSGFRWDFLLYSASAVYAGHHYVFKKDFRDNVYIQIFNIYLIANAFWILVIRASFSNRFAYLSWFLMAFVIFYPLLRARLFKRQQLVLANIMILYFGFTYFMYFFYK